MKNLNVAMLDYFRALKETGKTKQQVIEDVTKLIVGSGFYELLDVDALIQRAIEEASLLPAGVNDNISPS